MRALHRLAHLAAVIVATGCATFGSFHSVTTIDPDKTFLLGGDQPGAFVVVGRNTGSAPIIVYADRDGRRDSITTILPGGTVDAEFPARTTAAFRNGSRAQGAQITLQLRGSTQNLGMRYEASRR